MPNLIIIRVTILLSQRHPLFLRISHLRLETFNHCQTNRRGECRNIFKRRRKMKFGQSSITVTSSYSQWKLRLLRVQCVIQCQQLLSDILLFFNKCYDPILSTLDKFDVALKVFIFLIYIWYVSFCIRDFVIHVIPSQKSSIFFIILTKARRLCLYLTYFK